MLKDEFHPTLQMIFDTFTQNQKNRLYLALGEIVMGEPETEVTPEDRATFSLAQWDAFSYMLKLAKAEGGRNE